MSKPTVDELLVGKVIKSANRGEDGFTVIYFTDGTRLNIFFSDDEELVCELIGRENG
jgi:hypothetical protein